VSIGIDLWLTEVRVCTCASLVLDLGDALALNIQEREKAESRKVAPENSAPFIKKTKRARHGRNAYL
jgi:hypothetical protein